MKSVSNKLSLIGPAFFSLCVLAPTCVTNAQAGEDAFQLTSMTFQNDSTLPISMIDNIVQNGSNTCSVDGTRAETNRPSYRGRIRRAARAVLLSFYTT